MGMEEETRQTVFPLTHSRRGEGRIHPSESYSQKVTTTPHAIELYRHSQLLYEKVLVNPTPNTQSR